MAGPPVDVVIMAVTWFSEQPGNFLCEQGSAERYPLLCFAITARTYVDENGNTVVKTGGSFHLANFQDRIEWIDKKVQVILTRPDHEEQLFQITEPISEKLICQLGRNHLRCVLQAKLPVVENPVWLDPLWDCYGTKPVEEEPSQPLTLEELIELAGGDGAVTAVRFDAEGGYR